MKLIPKLIHALRTYGVVRVAQMGARYAIEGDPVPFWNRDKTFLALERVVSERTLLDKKRLFQLYELMLHAQRVPGDLAELGVYRGGTARLIGMLAKGRPLRLFDTFAGLPASLPGELMQEKDFADTSVEEVGAFLSGIPNVSFHQGLFPASSAGLEDERFAFVHVDVDLYQSVIDACAFFYPRLSPGGVMVFDDFGKASCPGVRQALVQFEIETGAHTCALTTGQALLLKS